MPLRHIGDIVIWEGNYRSDILIIGDEFQLLELSLAKKMYFGY
jgi:hypothetical protein